VTPQDQLGGGAFMTLFHMAGPPTIAILGLVPVLVARDAAAAGHDPLAAAITGGLVVAFLAPLAPLAMRAMSAFTVDE
jgi:Cu/Ag efflux pump CusA